MARTDKYFDWIENYLDGTLSPEEREEFEKALEVDKALAEDFTQRKKISEYWNLAGEYQNTKKNIQKIIREEKPRKLQTNKYLLIAASVVVLFGITWVIWNSATKNGPDEIEDFAVQQDTIVTDSTARQQIQSLDYIKIDPKASIDTVDTNLKHQNRPK